MAFLRSPPPITKRDLYKLFRAYSAAEAAAAAAAAAALAATTGTASNDAGDGENATEGEVGGRAWRHARMKEELVQQAEADPELWSKVSIDDA